MYLVGAWVLVQAAATIFPVLDLPEEATRYVLIAAIIGLPVTILLAWFFDLTPEGIQRTEDTSDDGRAEVPAQRGGARAAGFVGVGMLIALGVFAAISHYSSGPSGARITSIAVLPFVDLSAAHDQEYFTDGVTEEIMSRLADAGLRVAARTSSFAFKGQNLEITEIARRLNVQAVLEGSIRREGNMLRVNAKLIDARTQLVLWSDQFESEDAGILKIQDEMSQKIVDALKVKLASQDKTSAGRTRNAKAQELYFKGLKAWHEGTDPQLRAALAFFEQAAAADSTYALAYAGIAKTYAVLPAFGDYPLFDALTLGKQAAARATSLTPEMGEAYAALGQISQNLEWDMTSALQNYRNAIRVTPNDATTHQWYAEGLMMTGDLDGASAEVTRALELDPLSPAARNLRAYITLLRGDHATSIRIFQTLVREQPDFTFGKTNFAFAALAARDYVEAARAMVAAFPQLGPEVSQYVAAASGTGDRASAAQVVASLGETQRASVTALLYAAIGDRKAAIDLLEQTYRTASDANLPYWLLHPLFDPLRTETRFQEIARGVGVRK